MLRVAVYLRFPLSLTRLAVNVPYPTARAVSLMAVSSAHVRHQLMRVVYVRLWACGRVWHWLAGVKHC